MKTLYSLCFIWLLLTFGCSKTKPDDIVAHVGNAVITKEEFKTRFATTPYFAGFPSDDPQTRTLALASLIGEKVLVEEAERAGLRDTEMYRAVTEQHEKEAVLEALLDQTFSDLTITQSELDDAFNKNRRVLDVEELVFETRREAEQVQAQLHPRESLSAWSQSKGDDAPEVRSYTVQWGSSEPAIEDTLWRLRIGETSGPVLFQGYYYVLRVAQEKANPFLSGNDLVQAMPQLRKVIEKRKRRVAYRKLFGNVMAGTSTKVPPKTLRYIAEEIEKAAGIQPQDSSQFKPVLMREDEYSRARDNLSARLHEKFITFADGSIWTIGDYLSNLRYGPYPLNYSSRSAFRMSLRVMTITMLEQEYIEREGRKRGLQNSDYVRDEKRMWSDAFLADQMRLALVRNPRRNEKGGEVINNGNAAKIDQFLSEVFRSYEVNINHAILDTLKLVHLKMVVFKTHFPGRAVVPLILPFDRLQRFFSEAYTKIKKREKD